LAASRARRCCGGRGGKQSLEERAIQGPANPNWGHFVVSGADRGEQIGGRDLWRCTGKGMGKQLELLLTDLGHIEGASVIVVVVVVCLLLLLLGLLIAALRRLGRLLQV